MIEIERLNDIPSENHYAICQEIKHPVTNAICLSYLAFDSKEDCDNYIATLVAEKVKFKVLRVQPAKVTSWLNIKAIYQTWKTEPTDASV